jgi:hypothetical protein
MNEDAVIVFDKNARREVLDLLDKRVDDEGIIVEKEDPNVHVLAFDGTELTLDEFGGVKKGSEVFIKNDLVSLMRLARR